MTYEQFQLRCPINSRVERVGPLTRVESNKWGQRGMIASYPNRTFKNQHHLVNVKVDGTQGLTPTHYREWVPLEEEPGEVPLASEISPRVE